METIQQFYEYSQLSMAAYAENLNVPLTSQALVAAGFTNAQADHFIANHWEVISQSSDSLYGDSGFSATMFHNTQTDEYVFANRGTAGAQDLFTDG